MDGGFNWWTHGLGVGGMLIGLMGAIPGVLALMKDTPESQRLRGVLKRIPGLAFACSPGVAMWAGFPLIASALAAAVALECALSMGDEKPNSSTMVMLVIMCMMCSIGLTLGLTDRVIDIVDAQGKSISSLLEVVKDYAARLEEAESELASLRASQRNR
jgi:formate hydrogenlyase subunit 3/multisubunit Na+/H+ antiporter MnhD subunit